MRTNTSLVLACGAVVVAGVVGVGSAWAGTTATAASTRAATVPADTHRPAVDHTPRPASAAGGLSACTRNDVTVSAQPDPNSAGAGSYTLVFAVTAKASATCTVTGYPRVTFADRKHRAVGAKFGTSGGTTRTVTLKPHAAAHVDSRQPIEPAAVYPDCRSRTIAGYLVTLPGNAAAVFIGAPATKVCTNHVPTLDAPFARGTGLSD